MDSVTVLIADADDASREGIYLLLEDEFFSVAKAKDGAEALHFVESHSPQVVLLDASLPRTGGLDIARQIKARWPGTKVIILTVFDQYLDEALAAGADGYLLKGRPLAELRAAICRVTAVATQSLSDA